MTEQKKTFSETENVNPENTDAIERDGVIDEIQKENVSRVGKSAQRGAKEQAPQQVVVKKGGGSALAFLALLIALGVGGAGYYFGQRQLNEIEQKLTALQGRPDGGAAQTPDFSQERAQIGQLLKDDKNTQDKIGALEQELSSKNEALSALQSQVDKLRADSKTDSSDWLLSEADFLLNNALRKLVLDNDIDTTVSLLKLADGTLEKVDDPKVAPVRSAIGNDLKRLAEVNNVDQNAVMQRLSQLVNGLDELTVLNVNFDDNAQSDVPSDSLDDWQTNVEKSAASFLNHFVRISPRDSQDKGLLAPNQDIYLRENIRLRLQIAILAVPRQQDELYKQSLEAVSSWIRSYFDTSSPATESFLKSIDELLDQSIYIDAPDELSSLTALDNLLNHQSPEVKKIELNADKALSEADGQTQADEKQPAPEQKADDTPAAQPESAAGKTENSAPAAAQPQEPQPQQ